MPSPAATETPATPSVVVSPRAEARLRSGHLWIYRSDVVRVAAEPGDVVGVIGPRARLLGHALYSSTSLIALRMLARGESRPEAALWRDRIAAALQYREGLGIQATAYRVVHAEGDLLPSIVVDRYGEYVVAQFLSQGAERVQQLICEFLVDLLRPRGILARNDARVRGLEGLESRVELLYGDVPQEIVVREGDLDFGVRPWTGQKTGAFLDQRENRAAARTYARGRALDCFAYHGGFALQLARAADRVTAVESSQDAAETLLANAGRNGLEVDVRVANAFDVLREFDRAGERFDTIVLDPPAFAKNRASVPRAEAGYKEINLRALRLLAPGGILLTCTCSHHVGESRFEEIVVDAARDARVSVALVEKRMQSRDHPVLLTLPETRYLTCLVLRRLA